MKKNHTFKDYYELLSPEGKVELAEKAGTSVAYLSHLATGFRKAGADMIARLTVADKNITVEMLRPDLYRAA